MRDIQAQQRGEAAALGWRWLGAQVGTGQRKVQALVECGRSNLIIAAQGFVPLGGCFSTSKSRRVRSKHLNCVGY